MRINQYIASAGVCSRRKADELIAEGRVKVNGARLTSPGYHVEEGDVVEVDGVRVEPAGKKVYYLLNKPAGFVTATEDPVEKTVMELLPAELRHLDLKPVGRLDKDTTGLLLLTNDGALAHSLLDPKRHVWKTYAAQVSGRLDEEDVSAFEQAVDLAVGCDDLAERLRLQHRLSHHVIGLHTTAVVGVAVTCDFNKVCGGNAGFLEGAKHLCRADKRVFFNFLNSLSKNFLFNGLALGIIRIYLIC